MISWKKVNHFIELTETAKVLSYFIKNYDDTVSQFINIFKKHLISKILEYCSVLSGENISECCLVNNVVNIL
jgi:hypothetical protein